MGATPSLHALELFMGIDAKVCEWIDSYQKDESTPIRIRKFWSTHVPELFKIPLDQNSLTNKYDRELIEHELFRRLEQFISLSPDPNEYFNFLAQNDRESKLCGKVFKSNEPIYMCKDCSCDYTCVRCIDCFKNSSHKNHRYKVDLSSGAGFCDCGDPEAWKTDPYCDNHKPTNENLVYQIDMNTRLRFRILVSTIVNFCYEILCWENSVDLPKDLESEEAAKLDYYATILFNDEIHSFDQVISSLTRAIACNNKDAKDFTAMVDQEGRSIVRVSTFEECLKVKTTVERATSRSMSAIPLKCEVVSIAVVAHQEHALYLLEWLNKIIAYHQDFRMIFSSVMQDNVKNIIDNRIVPSNVNILEQIMTNDHTLWKTASSSWHKLFINGMLMSTDSKKFFARSFTKLYPHIIREFIENDHKTNLSIIHLSVQIYTVPSIAQLLIEETDALYVIAKSFYTECKKHLIDTGDSPRIQVKTNAIHSFKRAQVALSDLKFLLMFPPNQWSDNLRKSFLHGIEIIFTILKWMQNMDSIIRQITQHLEFEIEWELAIYLQLKMSTVVSQLFEWLASDVNVLQKSVMIALENMIEKMGFSQYSTFELCGVQCRCINYDVSFRPVSIHLALSRTLAGLLLELSKHNISYASLETSLSLVELMELPLRTLVMISQYRASMWRRNGFSLMNQILFYHGATFREEMYDKDVIMMQYVGSLLDPNEFLIHLLNKFNLMHWIRDAYEIKANQRKQDEDLVRQTSTLVEEFLNLLLIIVSERHKSGVGHSTPEDRVKKEIIQWLCIKPCTHSDLIKNLSKPTLKVPIENLISEVATLKKPNHNQSAKYELKEPFYAEFNPFFYEYSRAEQFTAEENQLKRKRQKNEEFICCPPPIPIRFTKQFEPLRNLLVSKVFMHLTQVILKRVCDETTKAFSENQYEKLLHLIGVALHEEFRDLNDNEIKTDDKFSFTQVAQQSDFLQLLQSCETCARVAYHKSLTNWIQHKFEENVKLRHGKEESIVSDSTKSSEQCNESTSRNQETRSAKRNSSKAALLRQKIMDQMSAVQNKFIEENPEYFKWNQEMDESNKETPSSSQQTNQNMDETADRLTFANSDPIAIGSEQRGQFIKTESFFCMLCREKEDLNDNFPGHMVLAAFAQRSTVLSKNRKRKLSVGQRKKNTIQDSQQLTMPADLYCGTHLSTCGHAMHLQCYEQYIKNIQAREGRRPMRYGRHGSFNVYNEYLCPLCDFLGNSIIPVMSHSFYRETLRNSKTQNIKVTMNDWLSLMFNLISTSKFISPNSSSDSKAKFELDTLDEVLLSTDMSDESKKLFQRLQEVYSENAKKVSHFDAQVVASLKKLSKSISCVEKGRDSDDHDARASMFTYWTCSFTMQSLEKVLREECKPVFSDLSSRKHLCLQFLVRYCTINSVIYDFDSIRHHCIDLLNYLLINEKYNLNPSSILDVDAFSLLISLTLTSASLFIKEDKDQSDDSNANNKLTLPLANVIDQNLIQLMMLFHIVQIILTQNDLYEQTPMEFDEQVKSKEINHESKSIEIFYIDILKVAGIKSALVNSNSKGMTSHLADSIAYMLRSKLLPFLRCTALFYHFLTEISPPQKLTTDHLQKSDQLSTREIEEQEFVILCEYLALPKKLSELFSNVSLVSLARSWARHPRISLIFEQNEKQLQLIESEKKNEAKNSLMWLSQNRDECEQNESASYLPFKLIKQPHQTNQLIDLPHDYFELINNGATLPCPHSDTCNSRQCPTICLVCGELLCSNRFVNQKDVDGENYGACSYHTVECGGGVGIFLRINDCRILLLARKSKGCHLPAPYVDEYYETDAGLRRGNPLYLCNTSYKQLGLLWLNHGIHEHVARKMELAPVVDLIDWNLY